MASPREMFSKAEFDALKKYLEGGGKIFILLSEGGEYKYNKNIIFERSNTNLNYFLE